MIKVLFVCHGNICRSPMAEFIFKDMAEKANRAWEFEVASAATSTEELGNPVYPPARRILAEHGLACKGKYARQITKADYDYYDVIIGMDDWNIKNMLRRWGSDPDGKIHKLLSYTGSSADISDPWYTGDFEGVWEEITSGCEAMLKVL